MPRHRPAGPLRGASEVKRNARSDRYAPVRATLRVHWRLTAASRRPTSASRKPDSRAGWPLRVGLADWLSAVRLALTTSVAGPINIVGPNPVRNKEFTRALGKVLHRPTPWPIPRLALRVVLGEFANEAVISQRVLPHVLRDNGFTFQYSTVDEALGAVL